MIVDTHAKPPRTRRYTDVTAAKMSAAEARGVPARDNSLARTLSSTSESELVLRCRRSSRINTSASSAAFVRLPLCPRQMPYGELTMNGCASEELSQPAVG